MKLRAPPSPCPECGEVLDTASPVAIWEWLCRECYPLTGAGSTSPVDATCDRCGTISTVGTMVARQPVKTPHEGGWTICAECQTMLLYASDLSLRRPTDEEMATMPHDVRMAMLSVLTRLGENPGSS